MFHRTQLLLDQAQSYERAGQWQAAIEVFERVFEASWRSGHLTEMLEVLLKFALLYNTRDVRELAADYYALVEEISGCVGDFQRQARAINGLGIIAHRNGDIDLAEGSYEKALSIARDVGDRQVTGDLYLNLGIIASIRGQSQGALQCYTAALSSYEHAGDQQRTARALNNLGMLYTAQGQHLEASAALDRALHLCRLVGDVRVEGIVLTNRTELFLAIGNLQGARDSCDEAFEISGATNDSALRAETLKGYGIIHRANGRQHLAESNLRQAVELGAKHNHPLIESDGWRELSLLYREMGRNKDALYALNRAHSLYTTLQAKREQADIDKRLQQLEADFATLVKAWGESIEAKDRYTLGHCSRVANYACDLAVAAGMADADLTWFRMGAFLHDVGKTGIPEEVLNKPGKLTDEERLLIEQHTVMGDDIISEVEFPYDVRPVVRSHHERWDGQGYPDRLMGEEIPFAARILHVADVFDALTSTRSYRAALEADEALAIMDADIGSFDPTLLNLFRSIVTELAQPSSLST